MENMYPLTKTLIQERVHINLVRLASFTSKCIIYLIYILRIILMANNMFAMKHRVLLPKYWIKNKEL